LLGALRADEFDEVICCTAPTPRGTAARVVEAVAREIGCDSVTVISDVDAAVVHAYRHLRGEDALLVAGSLYVVGAARPVLRSIIA
jgi:folylpolyglutamate synthase/dihydropteroate synthase